MALPPPWLAVVEALETVGTADWPDSKALKDAAQQTVAHLEAKGLAIVPEWAVNREAMSTDALMPEDVARRIERERREDIVERFTAVLLEFDADQYRAIMGTEPSQDRTLKIARQAQAAQLVPTVLKMIEEARRG